MNCMVSAASGSRRASGILAGLLLLSAVQTFGAEPEQVPDLAVVPRVERQLRAVMERELSEAWSKTAAELKGGAGFPAHFKPPVHARTMSDPWAGMAELERGGLRLAAAAGLPGAAHQQASLAHLLSAMSATLGKPVPPLEATLPDLPADSLDQLLKTVLGVLDQAKSLRDEAIREIPLDKRAFMHAWPPTMVRLFGPQFPFNEQSQPILQNDRAFCAFVELHTDWVKLIQAAQRLTQLGDPGLLEALVGAAGKLEPIENDDPKLRGSILLRRESPHGLIVIGGAGDNEYQLDEPVALLLDLGGNDTYQGMVASSHDADHPHSVVIDMAGDDRYSGKALGLATGRLGTGLLIDAGGNDRYELRLGTGGAGFGGIGILCDRGGDDHYAGSRFTQGVALAGLGLLYDQAGDDTHTSHGYALGLGAPLGVGAVVDCQGNDSYQCGGKYPSGYNEAEVKPDDGAYQWDAFGIGMGLGRRLYPARPEDHAYALAGGVGVLIDGHGHDRYESSNFSQACGYYFGAGLKLDLAGDDTHLAARYGHAAGAHMGLGLSIDYGGADRYDSTGPTYNGGCAWDRSAFLCVDAGSDDDRYDFANSQGPARADIGSWSVFAELGGNDTYIAPRLGGRAAKTSLTAFFDAAGEDIYRQTRTDSEPPENRTRDVDPEGRLYWDQ